MKSVLYCGCTANAYMPFHGEHSLSLLAETSLFRRGFSLSLSDSSRTTPLFARYLARWPPAQPMKARGGELLRRSYGMAGVAEGWGCCLRNVLIVSTTPTAPRQPPWARNHPSPPHPVHRHVGGTTPTRVYFLLVRLPLAPRVRKRPTASYGTVLRILMDRLRNCWRN